MWKTAKIYLNVLWGKAKGPVANAIPFLLAFSWGPYIMFQYKLIPDPEAPFILNALVFILIGAMSVIVSAVITHVSVELYHWAKEFMKSVQYEANRVKRRAQEAEENRLGEEREVAIASAETERTARINARRQEIAHELNIPIPTYAQYIEAQAQDHQAQARTALDEAEAQARREAHYVGPAVSQDAVFNSDRPMKKSTIKNEPEAEEEITTRPNRLENIE